MADDRGTRERRTIVAAVAVAVGAVSLVGLGLSDRDSADAPVRTSDGDFVELDSSDTDAPDGGVADTSPPTSPSTPEEPGAERDAVDDQLDVAAPDGCDESGEIDIAAEPSRRIVVNEVHYHPEVGGPAAEYVELYNPSTEPIELEGWAIAGPDHCFEAEASIAPGATMVVTADGFSTPLPDRGGTVALIDRDGTLVDLVAYDDRGVWPARADGHGDSLHRIDANVGGDRPGNWIASAPDPGRTTQYRYGQMATWAEVEHTVSPAAGQAVEVSGIVAGVDAVRAELAYRIDFGPETVIAMTVAGDGTAQATIPGQSAGSLVRYRLIGVAPDGGAGTWPRQGDGATYHGTVVRSDDGGDMPLIEWFMPDVDYRRAFDDISLTSTTTYPAVFAVNGEVFDAATVRIKGQSSRGFPKPKWTVELAPGQRLHIEGVIDPAIDEFDLHAAYNDKSAIREILAHEAFGTAGLPMPMAMPVRLDRNGGFEGLYTLIERADGRWRDRVGLDEVYEVGNRAPAFFSADEAELPQPELRLRYDREGADWDDDDALREFIAGLASVSGDGVDVAVRQAWFLEHVDVPSVVNTLAVSALIQHWDFRTKNFRIAFVDDRWTVVPFDVELTWGRTLDPTCEPFCEEVSVTGPFVNDSNPLFRPFSTDPLLADMLRRRIDTLAPVVLDPGVVRERVDELMDLMVTDGGRDRERWGTYGAEQSIAEAADELVASFVEPQWERLRGDDAPFGLAALPDQPLDALDWSTDDDLAVLTNTSRTTVDASGVELPDGAGAVVEGVIVPPGASVALAEGRVVEWRLPLPG